MIVSKDADLHELSVILGFPPEVTWIRKGNCSTATIGELLSKNYEEII
jgi:predicted nuclease of predicted toxin-antitoxin system